MNDKLHEVIRGLEGLEDKISMKSIVNKINQEEALSDIKLTQAEITDILITIISNKHKLYDLIEK